ncbi:hypothetical protein [Natrialbaceae archaeon AArc-T1-2]|uniref:hypothetical protein n=1 Tax=Natrialbaceae archaeon AArc-T1-2 TaxID=3053904 RepID=UPI003D2F91A1
MTTTTPPDTAYVNCPKCGESITVSIPERDTELRIRSTVAAFGDHTKVACSNDHPFWVYYC